MPGNAIQKVAAEILSYFLHNPSAADDLEGIAHWRLLNETIHHSIEDTAQGLSWLVQQGLLVEVCTRSASIFRLNHQERRRAESFLAEIRELKCQDLG